MPDQLAVLTAEADSHGMHVPPRPTWPDYGSCGDPEEREKEQSGTARPNPETNTAIVPMSESTKLCKCHE